ncbi:hypothetical protein GGR58DRAFT_511582 [Xylaria digitata]|nr:hypothetical protein GGR58DRAFT_511582 [Xylaria digitata]
MVRQRHASFDSSEMDRALGLFASAIEESAILMALAPIRFASLGGAVSVKVFQNRADTEDIDVICDPSIDAVQLYSDEIRRAVSAVAARGRYQEDWLNSACRLFIAERKRSGLFFKSVQQGVLVYQSPSLVVYAASFDYALESKLRRMNSRLEYRDRSIDASDAVALVHAMKDTHPLRKEYVRSLDLNECGIPVESCVIDLIAKEYLVKHQQQGIVSMAWDEESKCYTYTNLKGELVSIPKMNRYIIFYE